MTDRTMEDEVRDYVRLDVRSGFAPDDEIVEVVSEVLEQDYAAAELRAVIPRVIAEERRLLAVAAESWPSTTDCDRLDRAFASLDAAGIVARQNFSCCGNCGAAEIWDEVEAARVRGAAVRGYVFFHMQDTESAATGHDLWLSYGATDEGEQPALAIAREAVAILGAHGLAANWGGEWSSRISIPLKWQRRQALFQRSS